MIRGGILDLLSDLTRIGFTEYEAKVYLALLSDSPATGYQLSKTSGVPRSMVYEALSRLHGRGVVLESVEDRASVYRPLPPELLLERHHDDHQQLMNNLRAGLTRLYNAPTEDRVWSLSGERSIRTYMVQLIQQAQNEIYLVLTDDDLHGLHPAIMDACERGADVHTLLTGEATLGCGEVAYHPPLESELHGLTGMLLVVVDGQEALIAGKDHEMATITRNTHLVGIARQFVWMEFFTQRIYARLGIDLLEKLDPEDRQIFESLNALKETRDEKRRMDKKQDH
ncbi:MAG: TrmB family transcriptional regulator [Anaerolineae bacterium]|nr:TrmB family transcriptional regulator [Anaerolineae bacterium]